MDQPSTSLIGIYVNLDQKINLIGPYIAIGCFLHFDYKEDVESILNNLNNLNPLQLVRQLNKLRIPKNKFYIYPFILDSSIIDILGTDVSISKAIRYVESVFKYKIYNQEIDINNPFFICQSSRIISIEGVESVYIPNTIQDLSLSIAKLYSQVFRNYYLGLHFRKYPSLWINVHKGRLSPAHFRFLERTSILPDCYIKHLTAEFYLSYLTKLNRKAKIPLWLNHWIQHQLY
jgi:hypothetical protein